MVKRIKYIRLLKRVLGEIRYDNILPAGSALIIATSYNSHLPLAYQYMFRRFNNLSAASIPLIVAPSIKGPPI